MLSPDLCSRSYTAEVLRTRGNTDLVMEAIGSLTTEHRPMEQVTGARNDVIKIHHSFFASPVRFHRAVAADVGLPRTKAIRGKQYYLYDVLVSQCDRDVMVAVPYHGLAELFFVQVDRALAGKRAVYEKLDITNLVIKLGLSGLTQVLSDDSKQKVEVGLTRCQLAYSDPQGRSRDLQQVSMSGGRLGSTDVYRYLIGPVMEPKSYPLAVTPILTGFALFADGVKKTSATTDRHGNFKLWVGPGATRVERLFALLEGIESLDGVVSTTSNLPILQSKAIREAGDAL